VSLRRVPFALPLVLLACGPSTPAVSTAPTPAPSASASTAPFASASASSVAPEKERAPAICLPKAIANKPLAHVSVAGTDATICYASGERAEAGQSYPCVTIDVASLHAKGTTSWKATEPTPATPAWTVTSTAKELEICKGGGKPCTKVKTGYAGKPRLIAGFGKKDAEGLPAAVNADGTKVFVIDGEIAKGKDPSLTTSLVVFGDTFDVKTGKRLSHVDLTSSGETMKHVLIDQSDTWTVSWMGERVLIGGYRCCGPAGAKELLDPKTGDTLILGDPQFFFAVDGNVWLVGRDRHVDQLELIDVVAGKSLAKLQLPCNTPEDGPELYALDATKLADGRYLVSFANPPGAAVLDPQKRAFSTTPVTLPVCP
jgi:hypothetical protein